MPSKSRTSQVYCNRRGRLKMTSQTPTATFRPIRSSTTINSAEKGQRMTWENNWPSKQVKSYKSMTCSRLPMMRWVLCGKDRGMKVSSDLKFTRRSWDLQDYLMRTKRMLGWVVCRISTRDCFRGRNHKSYSSKSNSISERPRNIEKHQVSSSPMRMKWTCWLRRKRLEAVTQPIDILRRSRRLKKKEKDSPTKRKPNASTSSRVTVVQSIPSAIDQSTSSNKSKRAMGILINPAEETNVHSLIVNATALHTRLKLLDYCPCRT